MTTLSRLKTEKIVKPGRLKLNRLRWPDYAAIIVLGVGAVFMAIPLLWMFSTSFRSTADAFKLPPDWIPQQLNLENYSSVLNSSVPFVSFFFNSIFVTTSVVVGQLITCSMAGYAFARLRFPGRSFLFAILLASLMVPGQVTIIPVFIIMRQLGLVDSQFSLILPGLTSALGVFLMRQFFLVLPQDLIEAAKIDGAGAWGTFSRIALPLAGPAMASLAILTFNSTWNDFFRPFIFINTWDKMTLPLGITILRGYLNSGNLAVLMAGVTMAIAPVFVFFLLAQRWFVQGIMNTGLKG